MKSLLAVTEEFIKLEHSTLAADATAGSNVTLTLENNDHFANADFVVIGAEGSEKAELQQVNQAVVAGTDIRVATLKFDHKADEPIVKYRYNQRKFYGSLTATGSYTELTADGSPVTIEVDDPQGTRLEYTGNEGYTYFKATYFNSTTNEETDEDDSDAVAGDQSGRYCGLFAIRRKAGLTTNPFITDERLENKRKQAENEINSALFARYVLPLSEVPSLISQICELLAAGYIDYEEFGSEGTGVKWLGEGRAILKQITNGTRRPLDSNFAELARVGNTGVLNGYPDDSEPNGPTFSMSDKY